MSSWPSVTAILRYFGFYVDYEKHAGNPHPALLRGDNVDKACNIIAAGGEVDPAWIIRHPECTGYIQAFDKFLSEHQWRMSDCQTEVVNQIERYSGHYDQRGWLDRERIPSLLSLKSGSLPNFWVLQEALYCAALKERHHRYALQLRDDGTYTLHKATDPRDLVDGLNLVRAYWVKAKFRELEKESA